MKRVLVISPHFPPVNAPDCQRVRMSLPYYRQFGWDPVVLAVDPRHRADWRDDTLLACLPDDVRVHHCDAFPRELTRFVGVNNLGLRCLPHLNRAAHALLRSERFDLVFFSTTQYLVTPLGRRWQRRFGVPYVIDLQDPWRNDYYKRPGAPRPPGGWKYRFARLPALLFEESTFFDAAGLMSVSPHYFHDLGRRYPGRKLPVHDVIPFGAPHADFEVLARTADAPPPIALAPGLFNWVATGSLGPQFSHALRVLCAGLRRLRDTYPELAARVRLHFVGTSYADPKHRRKSAQPIAEDYGVGDLVTETPHRVGYLDSLRLMRAADGLLLLGSNDAGYSPSKLYPYYLAQRPILALAHDGGVLQALLARLRCAQLVTLLRPGEEMSPAHDVAAHLRASAEGRLEDLRSARCDDWFHRTLGAAALAHRQCALFDAATARS